MDTVPRSPWLWVIILLFLAAFFAVSETAIASANRNKLRVASERGDLRADRALFVLDNFDRAITTILICTNIIHIAAAAIVTVYVTAKYGAGAVSISTIIMTVLVFFFGEMLPKSVAKKYANRFTLSNAGLIMVLMKVLTPFSFVLAKIGDLASRLTKAEQELTVTEDELHDIIEDMTEEGTLEEDEGELIQSAIEFGDITVRTIMTPIDKVVSINAEDSAEEILEQIKSQVHSRLPVYSGDLNHIIGILQIRTYIRAYLADKNDLDIKKLLNKPLFINQDLKIDELLPIMAEHQFTLAVAHDGHGHSTGVVSVEDILEELVGEIWDEDDKDKGGEKQ
ncbi:MAG: hemolysin family protein [Clostridia bacterium]|jgi:CBS domain containing-hemolysin-like protein|nr:HlyC/CorC family transporter [Bacillota bacterium]MBR3302355.1 HlyC/CorC family transporter [Bacillota bacterium]MCR5010604.1 hemolysin family protein [Clostridia bacterium]